MGKQDGLEVSNPSERPPRANLIFTSGRSPGLQAGNASKEMRLPMMTQWLLQIFYLFTVAGAALDLIAVEAYSPTSRFNSTDGMSANTECNFYVG